MSSSLFSKNNVSLLINISASPYTFGKQFERIELFSKHAQLCRAYYVFVNQVGANDDLIFDGRSFVLNPSGALIQESEGFNEMSASISLDSQPVAGLSPVSDDLNSLMKALIRGIHDYVTKSGFKKVLVALSGGIDSAVTVVLASLALGPENVLAISMPSKYSSDHSIADAKELARLNGFRCIEKSIMPIHESYEDSLKHLFGDAPKGVVDENVQARIRGNLIMAVSNQLDALVLSCGNKSELSVGYCTLYGDMCGSLSVLGDVYKTTVYALARRLNQDKCRIPVSIIDKPPSAELRPNQKDEDSLPAYEILDKILYLYTVNQWSESRIVDAGFDKAIVQRLIRLFHQSEYKRFQSAPILKVSKKSLGRGRFIQSSAQHNRY